LAADTVDRSDCPLILLNDVVQVFALAQQDINAGVSLDAFILQLVPTGRLRRRKKERLTTPQTGNQCFDLRREVTHIHPMDKFSFCRVLGYDRETESSLNTTVQNSARVQLAPCSDAAAITSPNLPLMTLVQAGSMEPTHDTAPALETSAHVSVRDKRNVSYTPIIAFKYALYLIISFFALAVLGVVGSIVYNGVMPPPRQLLRYECPGYTGPFSWRCCTDGPMSVC